MLFEETIKKIKKSADKFMSHKHVVFWSSLIVIVVGSATLYLMKEQYDDSFTNQVSDLVVTIRTKIVNVSDGCKNVGEYKKFLHQEDQKRIDLVDKLAALVAVTGINRSKSTIGNLGFGYVTCYVRYNDLLSARKNICDGPIPNQNQMIKAEKIIIYGIRHKNDRIPKCEELGLGKIPHDIH